MADASDKARSVSCRLLRSGWLKPVFRFAAWWLGLFALMGPLAVCPVCGQAGCPGGAAAAGVLGGVMAAFISLWRGILNMAKWCRQRGRGCTNDGSDGKERDGRK